MRRRIPPARKGYEDFTGLGLPLGVKFFSWPKAPRILQFDRVGQMCSADIMDTLVAVVDCDPLSVRVHRADLTADMIGSITILACRNTVTVGRKRKVTEYKNPNRGTSLETQCYTSGRFETLYFGSSKSNDFLRVYDKETELRKKLKIAPGVLPSPLVRFERVLKGDGVPAQLGTVGALFQNGATFDPFADVQISPSFDDITPAMLYNWQAPGMKLKDRERAASTLWAIQQFGLTKANAYLRANHRDPDAMYALMRQAVTDLSVPMPTPADLTARYQSSFETQLFGRAVVVEPLPYNNPFEAEISL